MSDGPTQIGAGPDQSVLDDLLAKLQRILTTGLGPRDFGGRDEELKGLIYQVATTGDQTLIQSLSSFLDSRYQGGKTLTAADLTNLQGQMSRLVGPRLRQIQGHPDQGPAAPVGDQGTPALAPQDQPAQLTSATPNTQGIPDWMNPANLVPGQQPQAQAPSLSAAASASPGQTDPVTGGVYYKPTTGSGGLQEATVGVDAVYDDPGNLAQYVSGGLGMSPEALQKEYAAANQSFQTAQDRQRLRGFGEQGAPGGGFQTYGQWLSEQARVLNGQYQYILSDYAKIFAAQYGYTMPPELMNRLLTTLQQMPLSERAAMLAQFAPTTSTAGTSTTGGTVAATPTPNTTALTTVAPALDNVIKSYVNTHATQTQQSDYQFSNLQNQITQLTGQPPDDATVQRLLALPEAQRAQALNDLPMPGTHLTVGQYTTAQGNIKSVWAQYFNTTPTAADIQWAAGFKDQQSLMDAVMRKPSHIPGLDIGTYQEFHDYTDQLRTKLWNTPTDHDFINLVHQAVSGSGTKPAPPN